VTDYRRLPILLVLLALVLGHQPASAGEYGTTLSESRWESVAGADACHLVHDIPRFGTLVLSQFRDLHYAGTLITRRPPAAARLGRLVQVTAPWKGGARTTLQGVTAKPAMNTVALDGATVRRLLRGLENGFFMALDFPQWAGSAVDVSVSPVNFRPALRRHLACIQGQGGEGGTGASDGAVDTGRGAGAASGATAAAGAGGGDGTGKHGTVRIAGLPDSPTASIDFSHGSARVDRTDLDTVRSLARKFRNGHYWSRIVITGATDSTGSRAFNRALGLARAIEIRNRLIRLGVDGDRIAVKTTGEDHPVARNDNDYDRARNRRVEIRGKL